MTVHNPSRHIGILLCGIVFASMIGCASERFSWRDRFGLGSNEPLPPNSLAGRVQQIERVTTAADSLDSSQREQVAQRLNAVVAAADEPLAIRLSAVRGLGAAASPTGMQGLEAATRAPEAELRVAAANALANIRDQNSVNLLKELLAYDSVPDVRLTAAKSLARFRTPEATQALASVLGDRDPAVQLVAMQSLESVTGQQLGSDVGKWKAYIASLPSAGRSLEGDEGELY